MTTRSDKRYYPFVATHRRKRVKGRRDDNPPMEAMLLGTVGGGSTDVLYRARWGDHENTVRSSKAHFERRFV